jgi:quercetin dioxygenase-like cupin family protein
MTTPLQIRRVITGHDANGKAIVTIDEIAKNVVQSRSGANAAVIWTTESLPADNTGDEDGGLRKTGTTLPGGSVFRVVKFFPGVVPRMHRTDSIDYAVVIDGEIDMELDDGVMVHLKGGDVLVQRGTIHNWINNGTVPCTIAFALVSATPVTVGGKTLNAQG